MSYNAPYLDDSGIHLPTYDELMQHLVDGYKQIFGSDVYIENDTMDYQLLSLYAKTWNDLSTVILDSYNARNVYWASGTQLDTLISLNGLSRLPATYSTVTLNITGQAGKTLAKGSTARDQNGYSWQTVQDATFDADGNATVLAQCTQDGNIPASADTITICETPVYYWKTVTNNNPATVGRNVQTDAQLRQRRSLSVSANSRSILESLNAALLAIPTVIRAKCIENATASTDSNGIPAHSICCVIDDGGIVQSTSSDKAIAQAIFLKRPPGIGTYGGTSQTGGVQVIYKDVFGNNNYIRFKKAVKTNVSISIQLTKLQGYDQETTEDKVKQSIVDYIGTLEIGENLTVSYLYATVYSANTGSVPTFIVKSVQATASSQTSSSTITALFYQLLTTSTASIGVTYV